MERIPVLVQHINELMTLTESVFNETVDVEELFNKLTNVIIFTCSREVFDEFSMHSTIIILLYG